jgi:hypothetical protein
MTSPRGHASARLQQRTTPVVAERGFHLLRDRRALSAFVVELGRADARYAVDVLAFALDTGDAPAHALVDRDGHGVTCLAPGMAPTAPVVPFATTTAFLDAQRRLLGARQAVLRERDADASQQALVRVVEHPHRLVRSEVLVLRALAPLFGVGHHASAVEHAIGEIVALASGQRRGTAALQASWKLLMGGVAAVIAAGHEPAMFVSCVAAIATGEPRIGMPAVWQLAQHPAQTLALAEHVVELQQPLLAETLVDTVLPALALRFPAFHKDAHQLTRALQTSLGKDATGLVDTDAAALDLVRQLALVLPIALRRVCPDDVARAHLANSPALATRLRGCATVDDVVDSAAPWTRLVLRAWALAARRSEAPRTAPRADQSLTDTDRVALALWRTFVVDAPLPVRGAGPLCASLIAHAPVEAILPGDTPEPAWALGRGALWLRDALPPLLGAAAPPSTATTSQAAKAAKAAKATTTKRRGGGPTPSASRRR